MSDSGRREHAAEPQLAPVCGGGQIGWLAVGCGTPLVYEHTANGLEYWRCPRCGNPHWWLAKGEKS